MNQKKTGLLGQSCWLRILQKKEPLQKKQLVFLNEKGSNSFRDKGLYVINSLYGDKTKNTIIIFLITFSELCNSLQFNQKFT